MAQINGKMYAELGGTRTTKYVAYAAPIAGKNIFGVATNNMTGCKFALENGSITVKAGIETSAAQNHPCWTMF